MLSRGSSSFSDWVHLRGLELTADWFEYQIRETWIHSWSRLISLFRDVQSVRCMTISFTYHLRSYMHRLHCGHFGFPHELISDRGSHFRVEVDTLLQRYGVQHHRLSAYRPQTNGAVEAANKNIKRILRKMVETSRDWSEKLPFALWAYHTSFRTSTGATPYSLVYGMEAVLPIEIEMGSLRVTLEQQISETEWAQSRFDQLSLLDERRLRAADHVQAYQRKMTRAFKKRVKPRPL